MNVMDVLANRRSLIFDMFSSDKSIIEPKCCFRKKKFSKSKNVFSHSTSSLHGHKKQKDSLKTPSVLSIFSLELKISGVVVQRIHQNIEKWLLSIRNFLVEMNLRLFQTFSVLMTMVKTLLRQFRRLQQMKKIVTNYK